jgi:hypothetical protein
MRIFGVTFLPLAGTVGTLAALDSAGIGEPGMLVLGGALCLRAGRRQSDSLALDLARLPLVVLAPAGLGLVFTHSRTAADVLYLALYAAARLAWRLGPAAAAAAPVQRRGWLGPHAAGVRAGTARGAARPGRRHPGTARRHDPRAGRRRQGNVTS